MVFAFIAFLTGCAEDLLYSEEPEYVNGEKVVEFSFDWPDEQMTRGFDEGVDVKHKFAKGDMIHVVGTFNTRALQEDGSYIYGKESRYGALQFDGISWRGVPNSRLTWPSISTDGTFYAYYVSGSDGVITENGSNSIDPILLQTITPTSDPLYAPVTPTVEYGYAVKLNFDHLCTYLSLIDLEPMVASEYFFTTDGLKESEGGASKQFNNAFRIFLTENDEPGLEGGPVLNFEFMQVPDTVYGGIIQISSKVTEQYADDGSKMSVAGYFLEPGFYETFKLSYPSTAPATFDYLTYDYNNIPKNAGNVEYTVTPPQLEAGTTYNLTITKSPGIKISTPPGGGGWDEDGPLYDIDVEDFLKAVCSGDEYYNNDGAKILERTANGSKLLHNVDFKYEDYLNGFSDGFNPNLQSNLTFDGNYHYIDHLGSPFLNYNYGSLINVGIRNVRFTATSTKPQNSSDADRSRYGALCTWNRDVASIENVRVENVDMTILVSSSVSDGDDGSETHNIGGVTGSNTGMLNEVGLDGTFNITVRGTDNNVSASVLIGGIAGQNAAGATISNASMLSNSFNLNITNGCKGSIGSYSIGGATGESTGNLVGVILSNVKIDSRESSGVTSYIGGLAGQVSSSSDSSGIVDSCIVGGVVYAGVSAPYNDLNSASYIGGLVGTDLNVPVIDSRSSVSVYGSQSAVQGVLYAAGGTIGRIRMSQANTYRFESIYAYGEALAAPQGTGDITGYVGNFAGIVPAGQTWENDYAVHNIQVRAFPQVQYIGTTMN